MTPDDLRARIESREAGSKDIHLDPKTAVLLCNMWQAATNLRSGMTDEQFWLLFGSTWLQSALNELEEA